MDTKQLTLINDINRAIIKLRGLYNTWSEEQGISYNEMLILYTIREFGYCTQKQICKSYLMPKQTIHNSIKILQQNGILKYDLELSKGREKAFVLTQKGTEYAAPFLKSLDNVEKRALELSDKKKLKELTNLLLEYDEVLNKALEQLR